jgi:subtilase family serine protease
MTRSRPRARPDAPAFRRLLRAAAAGLAAAGLLIAACSSPAAPRQAGGPGAGHPPVANPPVGNPPASAAGECDSVTTCYTPRQIQVAYGVRPLLDRGIDGRGQTVVLPELAETRPNPPLVSDLRQDMARFDRIFGLPAAHMRVVTSLAGAASPWLAYGEEVLDVEMVHVIAPGATIVVALVKATSLDKTPTAVAAAVAALRLGISEGGIISISASGQAGGENCDTRAEVASLHAALRAAADHHVTVVAASGDVGAVGEPCAVIKGLIGGAFPPVKEVNLPASDPFVLAAGGTTLAASHQTGAYVSESGWGLPFGSPGSQVQGSGGGFSRLFSRPAYQDGIRGIGATRGVPDVASDAAPHTGMTMVISSGGSYTIRNTGGTSATAPFWAGLIALADQYAGRHLGFINPALYRIAASSHYHQAFHDITTGSNTVRFPPRTITGYQASPGWDPVTGLGSPDVQVLVPLLARYAGQ